jgi:hypothetical protein
MLDRSNRHKFLIRRYNLDVVIIRVMVLMWLWFVITAIYQIIRLAVG